MHQILGWIGAGLVLSAYFLLSTKKIASSSETFHLMNLFGAIGILVNVYVQRAWPSFFLNIIWVLIAIYGLFQTMKKTNKP